MLEPLLSIQEVAAHLRIHVRTVYRRIDKGDLPEPIKIGSRSLMPVSAVESLLKKGTNRKPKKRPSK
jgi:excisionase family DNA binding protein